MSKETQNKLREAGERLAAVSKPEITKRRVTMRSTNVVGYDTKGKPVLQDHEAVDYVLPEHLDAYVADAQTKWTSVEVSEEPDAGPGGYDGDTHIHPHMEG